MAEAMTPTPIYDQLLTELGPKRCRRCGQWIRGVCADHGPQLRYLERVGVGGTAKLGDTAPPAPHRVAGSTASALVGVEFRHGTKRSGEDE